MGIKSFQCNGIQDLATLKRWLGINLQYDFMEGVGKWLAQEKRGVQLESYVYELGGDISH